ncbi:MAG: pyridoxal-phosphate dependent enzyme [Eggerthella sp.]|uniref:pyridoxal-phosphate dependent enzyme n=1 Tax=Eggerthella sp. TaxID=1929886 RepID=UPI002915C3C8|nr:pyridoxal-phosphate dependent enzyme [Eggerthella sp.]MDU6386406.1 pyridoxal-phosphate dependent enzyme [Eggerthella sp.]
MIYDNVLQAMGHTPLVRLNRLSEANAAQILVKFEGVNVGGSIKTRTALQMIESAERLGEIGPDSIIVEPTSGNQGIGLALVCAVRGYRARIIMPDSVSEERRTPCSPARRRVPLPARRRAGEQGVRRARCHRRRRSAREA